MALLLDSAELRAPAGRAAAPRACRRFGTCAGMILLAAEVLDGRPDQAGFGVIDISVRRNAFGRQVDSFEADLAIPDARARAGPRRCSSGPRSSSAPGDGVEVLARVDGRPVACRQGRCWSRRSIPSCQAISAFTDLFLKGVG